AGSDNPLVVALRTGAPQRVEPGDGVTLDANTGATLADMGIGGFVAAPLRSASGRSDGPRAVVLLSRKGGVGDVDLDRLAPVAALSAWNLDTASRATNREVTLVDPVEGTELIYEVITMPALNHRIGERGVVSVLKDVTDIRHMTEELARSAERIQTADLQIRA